MKLRFTTFNDKVRSRILLRELDEPDGPRLHFRYLNANDDPTPNVLVLGSDLNNNIGGINLHYLDRDEIAGLRTVMPQILKGTNLKSRYDIGKNILPDIFDEYYRTYDTQYIKPIEPGELPTWEPEPMIPSQPPQKPPVPPQPAPTVPPRAPAGAPPARLPTPPRPQIPAPQVPPGMIVPPTQVPVPQVQPQVPAPPPVDKADLQTLAMAYKQRMAQAAALKAQEQELETQVAAKRKLDQERAQNLKDLTAPAVGDPLNPAGQMESITYYSPSARRWISENIRI